MAQLKSSTSELHRKFYTSRLASLLEYYFRDSEQDALMNKATHEDAGRNRDAKD